MTTKNTFKKTARVKLMDYLARADHSEKELREKLGKHYDEDVIDKALAEAKERGWLLPPEELSEKVAKQLHRKNKGYLYICQYLGNKGLPSIAKDHEIELEKAHSIAHNKLKDPQDVKKLAALLKNRGFDTETIAKVIHEIR